MYKIEKSWIGLLICCLFYFNGLNAQEIKGVSATGSTGITIGIEELQRISDATPVRKKLHIQEEFKHRRRLQNDPASPLISSFPNNGISQYDAGTTQSIHSTFLAISINESNAVPPDCMGDVSETQVCTAANGRLKFYAKPSVCDAPLTTSTTGGTGSLGNPQYNIGLDVFFASVRGNNETTDPHVHYDRLTGRWFVVAINVATKSNRMMIAVSNSNVISNTASFTFYYFTHDQGTVPGGFDYQKFGDFPMVGLDNNALYIGALIFDATTSTFEGSSCYVIKKTSILSGGPLTFTAFRRIGSSSTGIYAPFPAFNDDPQATKGYFIGPNAANYGVINYIIISDPGGNPTSSTGSINVPATSAPINQVAKGSNKPLDSGDDRMLNVQLMKNKLTGLNSIWAAQNIAVNASGVGSSDDNSLRNAVRWYELNAGTSSLSLKQSGTLYDKASTNASGYWMGSIAASGQGHAFTGASAAGPNLTPNVIISGRYNGQTPGELTIPVFATTSTATYNAESGDEQRWGDYSQTVVDPSDNMTMWTFQEYATQTDKWGERAIQVKAPPPATPTSISPIFCNDQKTSEIILSGQSSNNSGFFDPGDDTGGPGFSKRLMISSTGNVTVSNIKLVSATQINFTINYSDASLGSQQIFTITNPDCQSVTFNYTLPSTCDGPVTSKPITIFPNPATGNIKILLQTSGGELRILDMSGRLMHVETANSFFITVDTRAFARGLYIVQYINGESKQSEKLLLL